jgi:Tol biopolymer transport system component
MPFSPNAGDSLVIDGTEYSVAEHPHAIGMPYGQEGRAAIVYQIRNGHEYRALKVFKPRFQVPSLVALAERLEIFADLPGLHVCRRSVLTSRRHKVLIKDHPDLIFAVVMPWIEGPTWMEVLLEKDELSVDQSLTLAHSLVEILARMEERGLAHCDLSGSNMIISALSAGTSANGGISSPFPIELVDVEQLFGPGLDPPELMPAGSSGYAHKAASRGLWQAKADRLSGAVLIAEILCWCDPRVREATWGESYFDPGEIQEDTERYRLMLSVLAERWGQDCAQLFEQAWESDTLSDCPPLGRWVAALPDNVPVQVAIPQMDQVTVPIAHAEADARYEGDPRTAALQEPLSPTLVQPLLEEAGQLEVGGDFEGALIIYREAFSLVEAGSSLAAELALIINQLERGQKARKVALEQDATISTAEQEAELIGLFDSGLAAYREGRWADAVELFREIVRRRPDYTRRGQQAARLLAAAEKSHSTTTHPDDLVPSTIASEAPRPLVDTQPLIIRAPERGQSHPGMALQPTKRSGISWLSLPALLVIMLLGLGGFALFMTQSNSGRTSPQATATLPSGFSSGTARAQIKATASPSVVEAKVAIAATQQVLAERNATNTALSQATVQAIEATSTAQVIADAQATTLAQTATNATAQVQGTAQAHQLATANVQGTAFVQATSQAQAQATLQAQNNLQIKSQQATAQALQIQTQQATIQAKQSATSLAAQQQSQRATAQAQAQQGTAQAKSRDQATAQAQAQHATVQAIQAATSLAAQQQSQQATSQAQTQMQAAQATVQAQQTRQAEGTAQAQAIAQATAYAQQTAQVVQSTAQARQAATAQAEQAQQATAQAQATAAAQQRPGRIAFQSNRDGTTEIYVMNADGTGQTRLTNGGGWDPSWSPDGQRIAFVVNRDGFGNIYVMNADGTGQTRLTNTRANDVDPSWSPDGQRIAFHSDRGGDFDIFVMNADGTGQTILTTDPQHDRSPTWSPDGQRIAFQSRRGTGSWDIYVMNPDGTGVSRLTNNPDSTSPAWSRDGQRIVFESNRNGTGNLDIYVMNADGTGQTRLTNYTTHEEGPTWSPDGQRIAFSTHTSDQDINIYVINANGTGVSRLTTDPAWDTNPSWSQR